MSRAFERVARGTYAVKIPAVLTRKQIKSSNWQELRTNILDNIYDVYDFAIREIERTVRNKK